MPEGITHIHKFCKKWGIKPCLYNHGCPLDKGKRIADAKKWHNLHYEIILAGLPDVSQIGKDPKIDDCVTCLKNVTKKMEDLFDEFCSQSPELSCNEARLCLKAHFVADFAYKYWYKGTCEQRYIVDLPKEHPFWAFVRGVGERILPVSSPKPH
ncbi:MAG: hypothetical protein ABSE63_00955 [Thermoguttaceae bacterium]|jgi:hypothetical protein